jgi:putative ABC transport system permease protein
MMSHVAIDSDFVPSFGLKLLAGKNFDKGPSNDNRKVLVNKRLTEVLGFENPQSAIGALLWQQGDTIEITGVLEDYHQMSLRAEVVPMVFMLRQAAVYFALRIESDNYKEVLAKIEVPWKSSFSEAPLDYFFLDEFYNKQYEKDSRFGKVISLFTGLAILIAILGLIGLASYTASQRTKEIGIRKVLGSSVSGIVVLLAGSFMSQVLIANVIGWPLAWGVMKYWLQSFPYRIALDPLIFLMSGAAIALIAFAAVSSQTIRAALRHPVKTLRYE